MGFVTPFKFVDRFLRASRASSSSGSSPAAAVHHACGANNNNAADVLMRSMVFYLLDLAVLEYGLVNKRPGLVAAAAVYLARATLGVRAPAVASSSFPVGGDDSRALPRRIPGGYWSETLEYYTGYEVEELEEAVRLLHRVQEGAEDCHLSSVFHKHKGNKCKRVALKTVVDADELGFL